MARVVMVNGAPGAGKTTLARPLAVSLGLPLLAKDLIKETLADVLGPDRGEGWSQALGAAAMESIWSLLGDSAAGAVVDANLLASTRPFVVAGLNRAGIGFADVIEVWCDVPPTLARVRFESRAGRHAVHGMQRGLDNKWAQWTIEAEPLALGRVIRVDTSRAVDVPALARQILRA